MRAWSAAPWWRSWVWRERGQSEERAREARAAALELGLASGSRAVLLVEHLLARGA